MISKRVAYRAAILALAIIAGPSSAADWPVWRGPNGDAIVIDPAVPTKWSEMENVLWKVPVPGTGHSSPVVSAGRVFLTSFDPDTKDRLLVSYARKDGRLLWKKTVLTSPAEKMHKNNSPASSTPACDGTRVWITFLDGTKIAVACYDFEGKQVWLKSFDGFSCTHGFCGTPVLYGDTVIINGDSDGDAFLAALTKQPVRRSGKSIDPTGCARLAFLSSLR